MNVFGIGTMELLVILLVAFVALGPSKTVEVARTIGRMTREARRTFTDIMEAASPEVRDERDRSAASQSSPATPPTDPLPMPPHLQDSRSTDPDNPEKAEPDHPTIRR